MSAITAPEVAFTEVSLPTGVRLRCATCGPKNGQPVLLLHGYGDSWFSFSRLLPLLPPHWRALMPDQRGHGGSARPQDGYAMVDFTEDAAALLDALGVERADVVGHSMGSFIAQDLAATHPDRVKRLVLIGSASTPRTQPVRDLEREVAALRDPVPRSFIQEFQASMLHAAVPVAFFARILEESAKLPARVWRLVLNGMLAMDPVHLHRVHTPTLVLWGEHDAIFPRSEQDRLAAGMPHATLQVLDGIGHAPTWEDPARVARLLAGFLFRQPAADILGAHPLRGAQAATP